MKKLAYPIASLSILLLSTSAMAAFTANKAPTPPKYLSGQIQISTPYPSSKLIATGQMTVSGQKKMGKNDYSYSNVKISNLNYNLLGHCSNLRFLLHFNKKSLSIDGHYALYNTSMITLFLGHFSLTAPYMPINTNQLNHIKLKLNFPYTFDCVVKINLKGSTA